MSKNPKLSGLDLSMILVNLVIGMGIFRSPVSVAASAGKPSIFFLAWVFGGLVSLCGALTFAEIGSRYPVTGGSYKVLSLCYHPAIAFMINWIQVLSNAASIGAIALVGSEYFSSGLLTPSWRTETARKLIACFLILFLYAINMLGIRMSARTQNFISALKIGMLLILCLAVFKGHTPETVQAALPGNGSLLKAFGISLLGVFFTYEGYQWIINFGGDTKDASVTLPKAIFTGMAIVLTLYLLLNFTYVQVLGFHTLSHADSPASLVAASLFGKTGYVLVSLLIFVSISGYANAGLLSNPRMYYAMAEDGVLPPLFKKMNPETRVQEFVLTLFTAFILLSLIFAGTFDKMLTYIIFFDNIGLGAGAASLFILRKRGIGSERSNLFKLRVYPLIPLIFICSLSLVSLSVFLKEAQAAFIGFLLFLSGYPLYYAFRYLSKQKPVF